jgi:YidC/Oxa1 family membrane protein insertase
MKMQAMQPQIQAIQKKYKDNPSKMQEEFKKIGYNPTDSLTGCLPLLIQLPILIGLYQAIRVILGSTPRALFDLTDSVYSFVDELIHVATVLPVANKFLWLNLALPDPYYILPVLVFLTMFIQQRLMSPAKKKNDDKKGKDAGPMAGMTQSMQYTMPLMFGFFSLSFPSGLSIYFILSNLIGIGQGYITRANMAKEEALAKTKAEYGRTTGVPVTEGAPPSSSSSSSSYRTKKQSKSRRKRRSAKR